MKRYLYIFVDVRMKSDHFGTIELTNMDEFFAKFEKILEVLRHYRYKNL